MAVPPDELEHRRRTFLNEREIDTVNQHRSRLIDEIDRTSPTGYGPDRLRHDELMRVIHARYQEARSRRFQESERWRENYSQAADAAFKDHLRARRQIGEQLGPYHPEERERLVEFIQASLLEILEEPGAGVVPLFQEFGRTQRPGALLGQYTTRNTRFDWRPFQASLDQHLADPLLSDALYLWARSVSGTAGVRANLLVGYMRDHLDDLRLRLFRGRAGVPPFPGPHPRAARER